MDEYKTARDEVYARSKEFEALQDAALLQRTVEPPSRLIVRCDGVKLSKRFLKDELGNSAFDQALRQSAETVFRLLGRMVPRGEPLLIQRVLILSDEVSFVLSAGDNYYERRVMKLVTLLGGTLSSAMTAHFEFPRWRKRRRRHSDSHPGVVAFDARPIVVQPVELERYMRWRWLLFLRNEMSKVLRLRSPLTDTQIYGSELKTDIALLYSALEEHELTELWLRSRHGAWAGWPSGQAGRPGLVGAVPARRIGGLQETLGEALPLDATPF